VKIVVSVLSEGRIFNTLKLNMEDEAIVAELLEDIGEFLNSSYAELEEDI
jgi:hypothetical protein